MNNYLIIDANQLSYSTITRYLRDVDSSSVIEQLACVQTNVSARLESENYDYVIFNDNNKVLSAEEFIQGVLPLVCPVNVLWIMHDYDPVLHGQLMNKWPYALLTTSCHQREYKNALRSLARGASYQSDNVGLLAKQQACNTQHDTARFRQEHSTGDTFFALTERQKQVFAYIRRGYANKVIACELGLSEGTVKLHVSSILEKLHVKNRTEAAVVGNVIQ